MLREDPGWEGITFSSNLHLSNWGLGRREAAGGEKMILVVCTPFFYLSAPHPGNKKKGPEKELAFGHLYLA